VTTTIDVVIPTLNAAPGLARTIASLGNGAHGLALSITVCDGGSGDDTLAIARRAGAAVDNRDFFFISQPYPLTTVRAKWDATVKLDPANALIAAGFKLLMHVNSSSLARHPSRL
jgi:glycosyltransferase involved in cell wall biosynthesis